MRPTALILAASGTSASNPVLSFLLGYGDYHQTLVGSVVHADSHATTVAYTCANNDRNCYVHGPQTITQGPSTWAMNYYWKDSWQTYSQNANCKLDPPKDQADCQWTISQNNNNRPYSTHGGGVTHHIRESMSPITITAGAEKLGGKAAAQATDAGAKPTGVVGDSTNAEVVSSKGGSSSSATETASAKSSSSTAAAPAVTKNAVLAGAAAVAFGAMAM